MDALALGGAQVEVGCGVFRLNSWRCEGKGQKEREQITEFHVTSGCLQYVSKYTRVRAVGKNANCLPSKNSEPRIVVSCLNKRLSRPIWM